MQKLRAPQFCICSLIFPPVCGWGKAAFLCGLGTIKGYVTAYWVGIKLVNVCTAFCRWSKPHIITVSLWHQTNPKFGIFVEATHILGLIFIVLKHIRAPSCNLRCLSRSCVLNLAAFMSSKSSSTPR